MAVLYAILLSTTALHLPSWSFHPQRSRSNLNGLNPQPMAKMWCKFFRLLRMYANGIICISISLSCPLPSLVVVANRFVHTLRSLRYHFRRRIDGDTNRIQWNFVLTSCAFARRIQFHDDIYRSFCALSDWLTSRAVQLESTQSRTHVAIDPKWLEGGQTVALRANKSE